MASKVLIVGAGPVGMVVALELAKYGVEFDIIDKRREKNSYSKALSVSAASLKIFQGLGLGQAFLDRGSRVSDVYIYWDGRRCCHIDKRHLGEPFDYYLSLPQPETEEILEEKLAELDVSPMLGCECVRVEPRTDCVVVECVNSKTGEKIERAYEYVVACDGAHSSVARMVNLKFDEYDYQNHFVVADVTLDKYPFENATAYYVRKDGFLIYLPMSKGIVRLVASKPGALLPDRPIPTIDEVQEMFDIHVPLNARIVDLKWSSTSRFFSRIARTNSVGRVLFAGDSFHLFSPIGGQGMNTGLQDAFNLGWKLSWVIKGLARTSLLSTYEVERMAVVRSTFERVHQNTLRIIQDKSPTSIDNPYVLSFKHRYLYKNELPLEFSGMLYSYLNTGNPLIGRQVPFLKILQCEFPVATSYDLPQIGRYVVLSGAEATSEALLSVFSYWSGIASLALIDISDHKSLLSIGTGEICLVRPDGYIGYVGAVSGLQDWFERNHHTILN